MGVIKDIKIIICIILLLSLFPIYIAWKKSEQYEQLDWKTGKVKVNKAEIIFGILYFTICIVEICLAISLM